MIVNFKQISIKNKVYNYYGNLVKEKKLESKNIWIDQKNYKDLTIFFAICDHDNSIINESMRKFAKNLKGKDI